MNPTTPAQIILASGSASRRAILTGAGVPFEIDPADIDEAAVKAGFDGTPAELAVRLADDKATAVSTRRPEAYVIGADQVMEFNGAAFDKPENVEAARARLRLIRGGPHHLRGAVSVARGGAVIWRHAESSTLHMRAFSDAFLERYLENAGGILTSTVGGYAFEGLGAQLFERVEGDFYAILGLSLLPLLAFFRSEGVLPE